MAVQIISTLAQNAVRPDPHLIGDNAAYDCETVIQVIDNDGMPNTPGATFTAAYLSTGNILAGGYTKSKDLVWSLQSNLFPERDVPVTLPTGCYDDTAYSCKGDPTNPGLADLTDSSMTTKGAAFVYKAGYQEGVYDTTPEMKWQKFFEHYKGVTAIALSRSETSLEGAYRMENVWSSGSSQWTFDPQPTPIYTEFAAAFLQSRCLEERSHKIVTFDYDTGEVLQAYPWLSR